MAEPFKNLYNQAFFEKFSEEFQEAYPQFDKEGFLKDIFNSEWPDKELKERMRHTSLTLHHFLTGDYEKDIELILQFIKSWTGKGIQVGPYDSLAFMFLPDYVEQYGLGHFDLSMKASELITEFSSCEFSIRPLLIEYPEKGMAKMMAWAGQEDLHVRRLASEGCRPRLPWAMALPRLKKDPTPILPILERLKNDPSDYVRRSVANNLNDIAKDNPQTVIDIAKKWKGKTKETDWVVKHACRTLLKQGNQELMQLFGFGPINKIKVNNFKILTPKVSIGEYLEFGFELENLGKKKSLIRVEYAIYYMKANGSLSPKIFKISEKEYAAKSKSSMTRRQSFKPITTRKFHLGKHQVALVINGKEFQKHDFELVN